MNEKRRYKIILLANDLILLYKRCYRFSRNKTGGQNGNSWRAEKKEGGGGYGQRKRYTYVKMSSCQPITVCLEYAPIKNRIEK